MTIKRKSEKILVCAGLAATVSAILELSNPELRSIEPKKLSTTPEPARVVDAEFAARAAVVKKLLMENEAPTEMINQLTREQIESTYEQIAKYREQSN